MSILGFLGWWACLTIVLLFVGGAGEKQLRLKKKEIGELVEYEWVYPFLEIPVKEAIRLTAIFASWTVLPAMILTYAGLAGLFASIVVGIWISIPILLIVCIYDILC